MRANWPWYRPGMKTIWGRASVIAAQWGAPARPGSGGDVGPAQRGGAVRFRVLIDGQPPRAAHGSDVDALGTGTITEQRLYQWIRQPNPLVNRQFEIQLLDPGVEAFAFPF